nr:hypothetical protein [uncultured Allomuricauda sp.]
METTFCPACKNESKSSDGFCKFCTFPFAGTEKEKAIHIGKFIHKKEIIVDSSDSISKSKKILYFISGANFIFLVISLFFGSSLSIDFTLSFFITLMLFLCGLFIEKNPMVFTIIPLCITLGIMILNTIIDPSSFFDGILIKFFIIGSLVYSIVLIQGAKAFKNKYRGK